MIEDEQEDEIVQHAHQETRELRRSGRVRYALKRYRFPIKQDDTQVNHLQGGLVG